METLSLGKPWLRDKGCIDRRILWIGARKYNINQECKINKIVVGIKYLLIFCSWPYITVVWANTQNCLLNQNTVEPRFTGPRFAGEPRFAGQEPADQTFHYISLLPKPRFTGQKTPILGIFSQKSGKMSWFFNIRFVLQMEK